MQAALSSKIARPRSYHFDIASQRALSNLSDAEFEEFQMAINVELLSLPPAKKPTSQNIAKHMSTIFNTFPTDKDSLLAFLSCRPLLLVFKGLYLPAVQNILRSSPSTLEFLENLEEDCIYWNDQLTSKSRTLSESVCKTLLERFCEVRGIELVVEAK